MAKTVYMEAGNADSQSFGLETEQDLSYGRL